MVFIGILHLTVFPLLFLAEYHGHGHELAVFIEQFFNLVLLQEFLAVVIYMEHDVGTAVSLVCLVDLVGRTAVA